MSVYQLKEAVENVQNYSILHVNFFIYKHRFLHTNTLDLYEFVLQ